MPAVKFIREKNRTTEDVFRNLIRPKMIGGLDIVMQKMTHYNKNNHTYKNRTGALENSVTWSPAKQISNIIEGALLAGGMSRATITYFAMGGGAFTLRNIRASGDKLSFKKVSLVSSGDQIYVDYAKYVEANGFPVLVQGIEKYKREGADLIGRELRTVKDQ